jgi:hypothetical protein
MISQERRLVRQQLTTSTVTDFFNASAMLRA